MISKIILFIIMLTGCQTNASLKCENEALKYLVGIIKVYADYNGYPPYTLKDISNNIDNFPNYLKSQCGAK